MERYLEVEIQKHLKEQQQQRAARRTPSSHASPQKHTQQHPQQPHYKVHQTYGGGHGNAPTNSSGGGGQQHLKATPMAVQQHKSDQQLLEMLTSTVACLKNKSMDVEALGCMEQSLWLQRRMFGLDVRSSRSSLVPFFCVLIITCRLFKHADVHKALKDVVLGYNSLAMQYLAQTQFDQCLAMLRKAEGITAPGNFKKCQSLQILTYNNIGCCYRK